MVLAKLKPTDTGPAALHCPPSHDRVIKPQIVLRQHVAFLQGKKEKEKLNKLYFVMKTSPELPFVEFTVPFCHVQKSYGVIQK